MAKGTCQKKTQYFSLVTVTDKGQLAIPRNLREDLGIEKGSKLIAVKRADGKGLNLLKLEVIDDAINKITND